MTAARIVFEFVNTNKLTPTFPLRTAQIIEAGEVLVLLKEFAEFDRNDKLITGACHTVAQVVDSIEEAQENIKYYVLDL